VLNHAQVEDMEMIELEDVKYVMMNAVIVLDQIQINAHHAHYSDI